MTIFFSLFSADRREHRNGGGVYNSVGGAGETHGDGGGVQEAESGRGGKKAAAAGRGGTGACLVLSDCLVFSVFHVVRSSLCASVAPHLTKYHSSKTIRIHHVKLSFHVG